MSIQEEQGLHVLIAGSRSLASQRQVILNKLNEVRSQCSLPWLSIISGGAQGPDKIGEDYAKIYNINITQILPLTGPDGRWTHRGAGLQRNTDLVKACNYAIIFWDGISKGTLDTITKLQKFGKPYLVLKF